MQKNTTNTQLLNSLPDTLDMKQRLKLILVFFAFLSLFIFGNPASAGYYQSPTFLPPAFGVYVGTPVYYPYTSIWGWGYTGYGAGFYGSFNYGYGPGRVWWKRYAPQQSLRNKLALHRQAVRVFANNMHQFQLEKTHEQAVQEQTQWNATQDKILGPAPEQHDIKINIQEEQSHEVPTPKETTVIGNGAVVMNVY
ncbi:MAG: hypothetical protein H7A33_00940 [Deltaproteobacteria bacterium]|nr:hypothetical protein [Deltaproteobacteria bacterium]